MTQINPAAHLISIPILTVPTVVEIEDDALPGCKRNRMCITVWVDASGHSESQSAASRALTIGFLERTLEALKALNSKSFDSSRAQPIGPSAFHQAGERDDLAVHRKANLTSTEMSA